MNKKLFKTKKLFNAKSKIFAPTKSAPADYIGLTLKGTASSLTQGIVQLSQEGFGYMTR